MRKLFALIAVFGMLTIGASSMLMAQENETVSVDTQTTETEQPATSTPTQSMDDEENIESSSFHAVVKQKFIEGGAAFMSFVILALIFGLAISIERVIYLNLASTNSKEIDRQMSKMLWRMEELRLPKKFAVTTRGPIASIFYQGLIPLRPRYRYG